MAHSCLPNNPHATFPCPRSPLPPVPRLPIATAPADDQNTVTSTMSSPSTPRVQSASEFDELMHGIERVRLDDSLSTPRSDNKPKKHIISNQHTLQLSHWGNIERYIYDSIPSPPQHPRYARGLFAMSNQINDAFSNNDAAQDTRYRPSFNPQSNFAPKPHLRMSMVVGTDYDRILRELSPPLDPKTDFPTLFKVFPCKTREACIKAGNTADCFFFHSKTEDRRRADVSTYKPHMCRFIDDVGGCRKADRCPFAHNDFERRFHIDRYGRETCRDFLRGDCPRSYCTFRHEVSSKAALSLAQMHAMNDKEMLQLVLKIDEPTGRALCEKLLRRFGHNKKNCGWKLEGFNPHGRDEQKVKFVSHRAEQVKKILKATGEKKWACILKTTSLRDMMSGVRKLAEEIRERSRSDARYVENRAEVQRLIRLIFSNTNWSCHAQEGDNPFLVTPENQNDAMGCLEKLVTLVTGGVSSSVRNDGGTPGVKRSRPCARKDNGDGRGATKVKKESVVRGDVGPLWALPSSLGNIIG